MDQQLSAWNIGLENFCNVLPRMPWHTIKINFQFFSHLLLTFALNFPFLRPTHTLCGDNISSLLIHVIKIQALFYNDLCRRNISPLLIHAVKIQALFYNGLCRRNTSPPLIHAVKILAPLYNGLSKSGIPRQASKRLQAWKRQKYIFPPIFALQWVSFYR